MRLPAYAPVLALPLLAALAHGKAAWKPLFNGTSLAPDWYAIGDQKYWTVDPKDSSIVASSGTQVAPRTLLATTRKDFDQFTVKYAYRLKAGCSGFFFRATPGTAPNTTTGAQVEAKIENGKMEEVGSIYAMPQPGWVVQHSAAWSARVAPDPDAWQRVVLTVKRPFIYVNVNGVQAIGETHPDSLARGAKPAWDYTRTPALANPGQFALQIHDGEIMDVRFKDIAILEGCGDPTSARYDGDYVAGLPKQAAVYQDNGTCAGTGLASGAGDSRPAFARASRQGGAAVIESLHDAPHALELSDLAGRTVFSGTAPGRHAFRVGSIHGGVYLARLSAGGIERRQRLLIP